MEGFNSLTSPAGPISHFYLNPQNIRWSLILVYISIEKCTTFRLKSVPSKVNFFEERKDV